MSKYMNFGGKFGYYLTYEGEYKDDDIIKSLILDFPDTADLTDILNFTRNLVEFSKGLMNDGQEGGLHEMASRLLPLIEEAIKRKSGY